MKTIQKVFFGSSILILFVIISAFTKSTPSPPVIMEKESKPAEKVLLTNDRSDLPSLKPIDSMVNRLMKNLRLTGATIAVVKDEKLVYSKGFGYADKENKTWVQPYHLFRIGSVSKLVTAITILDLVEKGKIGLDDYVFGKNGILKGELYDVIKNRNFYKIKVKHLLNHTSGWSLVTFGDPMFIPHKINRWEKTGYPLVFDDVIKFVVSKNLPYVPGTRFSYSNFGYCLLGRIVEEISGTDYESYVQKTILSPHGINHMHIAGNFEKDRLKNEVKYYDFTADNQAVAFDGSGKKVMKPYGADDLEMLGPAGGWLANSVDLMRLLVLVDGYSKKHKDILSDEMMDKMIKGVGGKSYPLGWRSVKGDHWWRTGTLSGTSALLTRDINGMSWVIVTNTTNNRSRGFTSSSRYSLRRSFQLVKDWPGHDLFKIAE